MGSFFVQFDQEVVSEKVNLGSIYRVAIFGLIFVRHPIFRVSVSGVFRSKNKVNVHEQKLNSSNMCRKKLRMKIFRQ